MNRVDAKAYGNDPVNWIAGDISPGGIRSLTWNGMGNRTTWDDLHNWEELVVPAVGSQEVDFPDVGVTAYNA